MSLRRLARTRRGVLRQYTLIPTNKAAPLLSSLSLPSVHPSLLQLQDSPLSSRLELPNSLFRRRSAYLVKSSMASKSEPEKKKQKFDEVENKDPLLYPTRGGDDGKTVEGTPNDSDEDDVEEEEYSDCDGDKDETPPPYLPYYSSDEDRDTVEYKEYMRIIRESKGFTVPPRPEGISIAATGLVQVLNPECLEELSRSALVWYKENKKEDTETYELLRVDRGNARPARGILYFITFVARAVGTNGHVTFQAKVLDGLGRIHEAMEYMKAIN